MKKWLLYIMLVGVLGMHTTSCVTDDIPSNNCSKKDKVMARVVVPGGDTESLTVNTVRFLVFNSEGLCVDKTDAIPVTANNIEIENATTGHHEKQYVISVETDLEINKLMNGRKTYRVYAIVNETMGGDITGVLSTDFTNSLKNVSTETDLNIIMNQGRQFTFNAFNDISVQDNEPAFIMCGMAELVYNVDNATDPISIIINEEGIDRSMAKVTIESISSGGVNNENVSRLFVTSIGFVNLPNYVYVKEGVVANNFLELSTLDEKFRNNETLSYDRNWDGNFSAGYTFEATLRQTMGGVYYQGDNNVSTGGNESYTIFPPYGAGNLNDGKDAVISPGGGMIGKYKAGPASLLSGNKTDNYLVTEVNCGNFVDFINSVTGDAISGSTTPSVRDMTYDITVTTEPDAWDFTLEASYYIPENLSANYTGLKIEMVIGTPYIEEPDAEEIEKMCKDQWQGGGDWNLSGIQAWLDSYGGAKPPFTRTEYGMINNVMKYYYVNKDFAEAGWREQKVNGAVPNYFKGKEFTIGNQSKRLSFIVPIAVNKDANGITNNNVYRNHEYKVSIIASQEAYKAIETYGSATATAIASSRALTAEDLGITVIYDVKPLK